MSTRYTSEAVHKMVNQYIEKGGDIDVIEEGSLLDFGLAICHGPGLKTCIIREVYLNEWSSAYEIRMYNKMPKKYEKIIEDVNVMAPMH